MEIGAGNRFRLPFLGKQPQIHSCEIIEIKALRGVADRHGLVSITPEKEALKVIRRLNGKQINGKPIIVRQYFERRQKTSSAILDERRRPNLEINKVRKSTIKISGYDTFARKYS